jgi:hypothetical protein
MYKGRVELSFVSSSFSPQCPCQITNSLFKSSGHDDRQSRKQRITDMLRRIGCLRRRFGIWRRRRSCENKRRRRSRNRRRRRSRNRRKRRGSGSLKRQRKNTRGRRSWRRPNWEKEKQQRLKIVERKQKGSQKAQIKK